MAIQAQTGPLAGIRVIDCSTVVAGPLATQILADQGAEVIKVEPLTGDISRTVGHLYGDGFSSAFMALGRNKRSLSLNLAEPEAADIVKRLVQDADVFVTNTRPGVMARHGLGFEDLREVNPALVYAEITGFGKLGPLAKSPAYDPIIQALSGMAARQGEDNVSLLPQLICDKVAGLTMAQAITAALVDSRQRGEGQCVHVSLLSAALSFLACDMFAPLISGDRQVMSFDLAEVYKPWSTADGEIVLVTVAEAQFIAFLEVMGQPALIQDERFSDLSSRVANWSAMRELLQPIMGSQSTDHWIDKFHAADVPATAAYNDVCDLVADPQITALQSLFTSDHPHVGEHLQTRPAAEFSASSEFSNPAPAPSLGQHTREILASCSYNPQAIDDLFGRKLIS